MKRDSHHQAAELFQLLSHSARLRILDELRRDEAKWKGSWPMCWVPPGRLFAFPVVDARAVGGMIVGRADLPSA
ncbi:MAG: hypothetical protein B6I35_11125 [Anaerolineaceae bacterium 4572_32.2]|nr:MAG: hypothetical protein B6I35_11125 [Anaerolineaceae bacterium 4572_32.2]